MRAARPCFSWTRYPEVRLDLRLRARPVDLVAENFFVPAAPGIVSDDVFFVREVLRQGAGIGLLPSFFANADVASGRLGRVLPQLSIRQARLALLYPRSSHPRAATVPFREFLLDCFSARPLR